MKRGWMMLVVLAGLAAPVAAVGQASVYAEFTASQLSGGPQGDTLYGVTTGVVLDGPQFHKVMISGDIKGRFVGKSGERMDGITVGPRLSLALHHGLTPYIEGTVGFARFNDSHGYSSTDNTFQANAGIAKRVSPRLDIVLDYSYARFGYNFNQFEPMSYSGGLVYHFAKR